MDFSDEQHRIISRPGSFFVDACPGAGKTYAIVERFIKRPHLRDRRGIALISFTRAAADEVVTRTAENPSVQESPNFIGTIDTFINRYIVGPLVASRTGQRPTFRDTWSSIPSTTISVAAAGGPPIELELDWFSFDLDGTAELDVQRIYWKDRDRIAVLPRAHLQQINSRASARWRKLISAGYINCAHARALLQVELANPLRRAAIGARLKKRFSEAIVDEFQDCNPGDLELLKALHQAGINLVLIGDLDQSIYGFRDAEPSSIQAFLSLLGEPEPLTGNYRSTPAICNVVNSLRHGIKKDVPLGKNSTSQVPVYLLLASDLPAISEQIDGILRASDVGDSDVIYLAHAGWAAQSAARVPKVAGSTSKVVLIAHAASQFRQRESATRTKALDKIQHCLWTLLPENLTDMPDNELLAAIELTPDALRSGLIAVASVVDFRTQSPKEANQRIKQTIANLGWQEWLDLGRLPTPAIWPDGLVQPSEPIRWSTIHGFKGRQARAVVAIMTNTPGNYQGSSHILWQRDIGGESRRTMYVGASRAEELLIIAAMTSDQYRAALVALQRDGVHPQLLSS